MSRWHSWHSKIGGQPESDQIGMVACPGIAIACSLATRRSKPLIDWWFRDDYANTGYKKISELEKRAKNGEACSLKISFFQNTRSYKRDPKKLRSRLQNLMKLQYRRTALWRIVLLRIAHIDDT